MRHVGFLLTDLTNIIMQHGFMELMIGNMPRKKYTHDTSVQHIEAIKITCLWAKNQVIEKELENQIS